ncbi:MAG: hypothetical protein ACD_4C00069G0001 [uncultured bacterium (gcode 4)]|uniref:HEPN domain-containing protein n=1 Tax=uncultured bacterium (gcode 4) TaxID=1234023 RepID=K2F7D6_9BACT|nr:MAG: hypothetical protein ACD_4C00069G0001 [uncultured bacterium (gcode 4)]
MKKLSLSPRQKKKASTLMALGTSELEAAISLIEDGLYREALVHLYFTCFYITQAILTPYINGKISHKGLNINFCKHYSKRKDFPKIYIQLHTTLWEQRSEFNYRTTHSPNPSVISKQLYQLKRYVNFVLKHVPRVEVYDLLNALYEDNNKIIKDFFYDIYCPKTYFHHSRFSIWQPPFYLKIYSLDNLKKNALNLLKSLKVKRYKDYVIGLNSRINQYENNHILMLDIDSVNPSIESVLKPIGGVLLKSGRGYHFIGKTIYQGFTEWSKKLNLLKKTPILKDHIDKAHIEISLARGYSTLRVTSSPVKPTIPYFYKEL